MINHTITIIFSILTVEIILYFNFVKKVKLCLSTVKKIYIVVFYKKASEHWKEKTLLKYSQLLLLNSIKLLVILFIIFVFLFLMTLFYKSFLNYLISYIGFAEVTFVVFLYAVFRKKVLMRKN